MKLKAKMGVAVLATEEFDVSPLKQEVLKQLTAHVDELWEHPEVAPKWLRNGVTIYLCEHIKRPLNFKVVHFEYKEIAENV